MKTNIRNEVKNEVIERHGETLSAIQQLKDTNLDWRLKELLPKGKNVSTWDIEKLKEYLSARLTKRTEAKIKEKTERIDNILNAPKLQTINISVEWTNSRTWGANPKATIEVATENGYQRYESGSITGCGFDKLSTAVAQALNQCPSVLRELYVVRQYADLDKQNREIFGYGSGYGLLPYFEGGVGIECFPRIFDAVGMNMRKVASGKMFDAYTVVRNN